jgi:hypothetical protein
VSRHGVPRALREGCFSPHETGIGRGVEILELFLKKKREGRNVAKYGEIRG